MSSIPQTPSLSPGRRPTSMISNLQLEQVSVEESLEEVSPAFISPGSPSATRIQRGRLKLRRFSSNLLSKCRRGSANQEQTSNQAGTGIQLAPCDPDDSFYSSTQGSVSNHTPDPFMMPASSQDGAPSKRSTPGTIWDPPPQQGPIPARSEIRRRRRSTFSNLFAEFKTFFSRKDSGISVEDPATPRSHKKKNKKTPKKDNRSLQLTSSIEPYAVDGILRFDNRSVDQLETFDGPSTYWRESSYRNRSCQLSPVYTMTGPRNRPESREDSITGLKDIIETYRPTGVPSSSPGQTRWPEENHPITPKTPEQAPRICLDLLLPPSPIESFSASTTSDRSSQHSASLHLRRCSDLSDHINRNLSPSLSTTSSPQTPSTPDSIPLLVLNDTASPSVDLDAVPLLDRPTPSVSTTSIPITIPIPNPIPNPTENPTAAMNSSTHNEISGPVPSAGTLTEYLDTQGQFTLERNSDFVRRFTHLSNAFSYFPLTYDEADREADRHADAVEVPADTPSLSSAPSVAHNRSRYDRLEAVELPAAVPNDFGGQAKGLEDGISARGLWGEGVRANVQRRPRSMVEDAEWFEDTAERGYRYGYGGRIRGRLVPNRASVIPLIWREHGESG